MRLKDNYSSETNEVLKQAAFNALVTRYEFIHTPHLLLGLLDVSQSVRNSLELFTGEKHRDLKVRRAAHTLIEPGSRTLPVREEYANLSQHPEVQRILEYAEEERHLGSYVSLEPMHILTGIVLHGSMERETAAFKALDIHHKVVKEFVRHTREFGYRNLGKKENKPIHILEQC